MHLPFVNHLGLVIEEAASGMSRCALDVREIHMNSSGVVHGAVLFALVDTGMGAALFSTLEPEHACATIEAKINYFKPVQGGNITCTSELIHRSKNIASLEAQILVEGEVVARGFGTFSVFRRRSAGAA
ncbi:PaaI family thioesterase [Hydrogenophaga sp.]|uniref:PaaI family thioesterase n=1 Tax=Hydrogenophaga sp. TaxID=1904254 RepID=UPI002FCB7943